MNRPLPSYITFTNSGRIHIKDGYRNRALCGVTRVVWNYFEQDPHLLPHYSKYRLCPDCQRTEQSPFTYD